MRLVISGLERAIEIEPGFVSVLEVESQALFARVCQSLLSGSGHDAPEPYGVWDGENLLNPRNAFVPVPNPFDLPWRHRSLGSRIQSSMVNMLMEEEEMRSSLGRVAAELEAIVDSAAYQLHGQYGFKIEWDVTNYLKAFGFDVCVDPEAALIDNLIALIDLAADMRLQEALLFINLKCFLSESEFDEFAQRVFFQKIRVLLLEQKPRARIIRNERKLVVDQRFLEEIIQYQGQSPFSTQGELCINGFGAVTF